jgi:predicted lipoprotein
VACSSSDLDEERRRLLDSWGQSVVLATYRDFGSELEALDEKAAALCEEPSAGALAAARQGWNDARAPWKKAEVFAFGPYLEAPLRPGPKIDFWPARPDSIRAVLDDVEPIGPESAARLGGPERGMPAIEFLLYESGVDLIAAFGPTSRRCDYLQALTADCIERAAELERAWDPDHGDFLGELVHAGDTDGSFPSVQMALGEIVSRMAFLVENIRGDKLGRPLGTASGGEPQPDKVESPFSERSLQDIRDNLRGIERLFFGGEKPGELGLDDYLKARGRHFAPEMRRRSVVVDRALDAISVPLSRAVVTEPDRVSDAIESLGALQRFIQIDVANALSLAVGFNDNDGD